MKITRRYVRCLCPTCFGTGYIYRHAERVLCAQCQGKGEVDKVLNEIHSEEVRP